MSWNLAGSQSYCFSVVLTEAFSPCGTQLWPYCHFWLSKAWSVTLKSILYSPAFSDRTSLPHYIFSSSLEAFSSGFTATPSESLINLDNVSVPMVILHIFFHHSNCVYSSNGLICRHSHLTFPIVNPRPSQFLQMHSAPNSISDILHLWSLCSGARLLPNPSQLILSPFQFSDINISTCSNSQEINLRFLWMRNRIPRKS